MPMLTNTKFVERRYHVRPVMMKGEDATAFLLWYSSLLGQCLRLVSYATGALPHLRLRAFHPSIIVAVIVLRRCRQALPCAST